MSGSIEVLALVRTEDMLADCLTKSSVKPDVLIQAVFTGVLPNIDTHPEFRSLIKHRAFLVTWCAQHLRDIPDMIAFLDTPVQHIVHAYFSDRHSFACAYLHAQTASAHMSIPCDISDSLNECD